MAETRTLSFLTISELANAGYVLVHLEHDVKDIYFASEETKRRLLENLEYARSVVFATVNRTNGHYADEPMPERPERIYPQ